MSGLLRSFASGTGNDRVAVATSAAVDNYVQSTQCFRCRFQVGGGGFRLMSWKGITSNSSLASLSVQFTNSDTLAAFFRNNSGGYDNVASAAAMETGVEKFVVCRQRTGPTQIQLLMGDRFSPPREIALGTIDITGDSPLANSGQPLVIGNGDGSAAGLPFSAGISMFAYYDRWLTDDELEEIQWAMTPPGDALPGVWMDLGVTTSDGSIPNLGTGGSGAITDTTLIGGDSLVSTGARKGRYATYRFKAPAAAGGLSIPVAMQHYRNQGVA